jgi:hypothetical protein
MQSHDLRHDQVFFGRTEELYELTRNLQRGRHTLLIGEKGIGKSRLMLEARQILSGRARRIELSGGLTSRLRGHLHRRITPGQYNILYVEHPNPMGDCIREIAEQLHTQGILHLGEDEERQDWAAMKKHLTKLGSLKAQAFILEGISRSEKKYLIFFDNLDRISPTQQGFIEAVLNIAVICAAVVRMKDQFMYKRIWASFTRIAVGTFPPGPSIQLIDYFLDNYSIRVIDRELYRREVLKAANGNPFLIKNFIWQTSREGHVGLEDIRGLRRVEEGPFFNMGPIYIFAASMFTLFKIFSLGTNNPEFYIYFSALGFLVYLTFRIFRTFFLFRPGSRRSG